MKQIRIGCIFMMLLMGFATTSCSKDDDENDYKNEITNTRPGTNGSSSSNDDDNEDYDSYVKCVT